MAKHNRIWFVSCDDDPTVLLAINPLFEMGKYISWFDTVKERKMLVHSVIEEKEGSIIFDRVLHSGEIWRYRFVPLTLGVYEEKVRDKMLGSPSFTNKEEMESTILKSFEGSF